MLCKPLSEQEQRELERLMAQPNPGHHLDADLLLRRCLARWIGSCHDLGITASLAAARSRRDQCRLLRLRQRELDGDAEALKRDAALRIVEEGEGSQGAPEQAAPQYAWWVQGVAAGLLIAGVAWLYRELGAWDVGIAQQLARLESAQPNDVVAMIDRIEHRAEARQGNTDYALLLAEYYLSGNDPAAALTTSERLIAAGAKAPEILGKAAQAEFLAADRELSAQARSRAEQALAVNPCSLPHLRRWGWRPLRKRIIRGDFLLAEAESA